MKMPMGKFKEQPVEAMTTQYLVWLVTRDNIRFKYWPLVEEALRVIRSRDLNVMLEELKVDALHEHRPTPQETEQRKKDRAEKLRLLEEQRAAERKRRREERRIQRAQEEMQIQADFIRKRQGRVDSPGLQPPSGVPMDGSYWVRQARAEALRAELARRADPNDVSDLI